MTTNLPNLYAARLRYLYSHTPAIMWLPLHSCSKDDWADQLSQRAYLHGSSQRNGPIWLTGTVRCDCTFSRSNIGDAGNPAARVFNVSTFVDILHMSVYARTALGPYLLASL